MTVCLSPEREREREVKVIVKIHVIIARPETTTPYLKPEYAAVRPY